jgi:pyridoxine 4-dehydrogenase
VSVEQVERARQVVSIAAVQNHYNLSERTHEDVVDYCAENGIVFVPCRRRRAHRASFMGKAIRFR